jgi:hypothetical protein
MTEQNDALKDDLEENNVTDKSKKHDASERRQSRLARIKGKLKKEKQKQDDDSYLYPLW